MRANEIFSNVVIGILILSGCQPKEPDVRKYLNGWEYLTTFQVLPSKSIVVSGKRAKVIQGENSVLVVEIERKPILNVEANAVSDLHTSRRLIIELNSLDTLVTPGNPQHSKIYREILAMSPRYGANELKRNENLTIERKTANRWRIIADLEDFKFDGEFCFSDSAMVTNRHEDILWNE